MQIGSLIRRAARQFGDAPCLTEGDHTISFAEFDRATDRLGNALLALGLEPGDRVGTLLPNCIDCLIAYYALAKAGLVRVSLNSRETAEDHRYKLQDSGSRGVLQGSGESFGLEFEIDHNALTKLIESGDQKSCRQDRELHGIYRLAYTGGTTGRPKGVTLTTAGELWELGSFLADLLPDIHPGDIFLHASPISHASGAFFLPGLVRGAQALILPKFAPQAFIDLAATSGASMTFLVPTMLAMILEAPGIDSAELRFRGIAYGASPIAPSLYKRAQARFGPIFSQAYGQAESPMVITCLRPEDHDRVGSCGRPFTCADVAVFDDHDQELPPGEIGEIVTRGPQTMAGYWNRPEATAEVFRNGWLHTGDVGTMDKDGFFYLLDRKNDMLISGGFNVYPREVEDVLLAFEGVVEAAVVGLPDEKWGDRVHAVVAGRPGLDPDALLEHARSNLAGYKRPRGMDIWDELPKSAANKILRRNVRKILIAEGDNK